MKLSPVMARRIMAEAVTNKALVITITDDERKEIKQQLIDYIKKTRLWELTERRLFPYHIHISGLESICIIDYATWKKESNQKFCGVVFVTSRCLPDNLQNVDGEPIILRDLAE